MSKRKSLMINKIISGGQTGVDRAALDFALENDIVCGGFCPKGRRAEDGTISDKYPLVETNFRNYAFRIGRENPCESGDRILASSS